MGPKRKAVKGAGLAQKAAEGAGGGRKSSRKPAPRQQQQQQPSTALPSTVEDVSKNTDDKIIVYEEISPLPKRGADGSLIFADYPNFNPNLTPAEVLASGSFGGTYFRPIKSSVTNATYRNVWKEFPEEWFEGLDIDRQVISPAYSTSVNKYGVKCGADLEMWEGKGWIKACDPYGWFQWYCRFYLGRRCSDDERQISRGLKCMGPTGRWRIQLINKIYRANSTFDDSSISPVIRQTLQHWGYQLTQKHYAMRVKKIQATP